MSAVAEEWRTVPGHPSYEVSDLGRIRSRARTATPRVLSPWFVKGYAYIMLGAGSSKRQPRYQVHRLVLEAFVGPCPAGHEARHINGDPSDGRLANLAWGTRSENEADKRRHGTQLLGEKNHRAKLTAREVAEIRDAVGLQREIGERFGISQRHVSRIKRGGNWSHAFTNASVGTEQSVRGVQA